MSDFFVSDQEAQQVRTDLAFGQTWSRPPRRDVFGLDVFNAAPRGAARASYQVADYLYAGEEWAREQLGWSTERVQRSRARMRQRIRAYAPNPMTDSYSAQVLNSISNVLTIAAAGAVTGGQGAAAGLTGVVLGEEGRRTLLDAGVDPETAAWGGVIEGATMGLGVLAPAAVPFRSMLLRGLSGAGINVGFGLGYRGGMNTLLNSQGYPDVAARYQWFDPMAMTIDAVVGAGFGALTPGPAGAGRRGPAGRAEARDSGPSPIDGVADEATQAYRDSLDARVADNLDEAYAHALIARDLGHPEADALLQRLEEEGGSLVVERGRAIASARTMVPGEPSALVRAAAMNQADAIHRDIKTAPGVPASPRAQRAHSRAMREAARQAEADEPVVVQSMFQEALALRRPAREPMTLTQFVRRQGEVRNSKGRVVVRGGIKDDRGDIAGGSSDGKRGFASLISPDGRPIDDVALAAWESGYFPEYAERPPVTALIDALDAESRGQPRYSMDDAAEIQALEDRRAFEREFDERGIDINAPDDVLLQQLRDVYGDGDFVPWPVEGKTEVDAIGEVIREEGGEEAFREWQQSLEDAERYGVPIDKRDVQFSMGTGRRAPRGSFRAAMILFSEGADRATAAGMLGIEPRKYTQLIVDSRLRIRRLQGEGLSIDAVAARLGVDADVVRAVLGEGTPEQRTMATARATEEQKASLWWNVVHGFADGLDNRQITNALLDRFENIAPETVASIISQRRRAAMSAVRNGTADALAAKWGVEPRVVEALADASSKHRRATSPLLSAIVRLSQPQADGTLLSGPVIAERLRSMGFDSASAATVHTYQLRARNEGFDIPFRRGDDSRPVPARAFARGMMQVRGTPVEINATGYDVARILADQRRMRQPTAVRWMVGPDGVTYAWDGSAVWHADVAMAIGRQLDDFDKGVAHTAEELHAFDRARRDRRPQASRGVRGLFSVLERTIEQSTTEQASADQWAATLRQTAGLKQEELSWTGVLDWLAMQEGPVKRQDIALYLDEHGVRVMETLKSDAPVLSDDMQAEYLHLIEERDALEGQRAQLMERDQGAVDRGGPRAWLPMDSIARNLGYDGWGQLTDEQRAEVEAAFYNQPGREEYNLIEERLTEIARDVVAFEQRNDIQRAEATRWSSYTLPGGQNYRELLLTLPPSMPNVDLRFDYSEPSTIGRMRHESGRFVEGTREIEVRESGMVLGTILEWPVSNGDGPTGKPLVWEARAGIIGGRFYESLAEAKADIERTTFREMLRDAMRTQEFRSSHWAESNVLAHIRTNDRVDADGRRILFVEEIQSDWHQRGRERGYRGDPSNAAEINARKIEIHNERERMARDRLPDNRMREEARWHQITNELRDLDQELAKIALRVADAPFRKGWPLLALKRIARWAAEGGYDGIAWTTGDMQVARFNLGESADGMRAFYDRNLVNIANDLGKKHGAKAGRTMIDVPEGGALTGWETAGGQSRAAKPAHRASVHYLPITSELRAAALDGLPLFSARREGLAYSSKLELETTLAREFGADWGRLSQSGRVEILSNPLDLDFGAGLPFSVKALHSRRDGKVYLFADNIAPGEARGVLLHEVGVHAGMRTFLGRARYADLMRSVQGLVEANHPDALRARELAREQALDPSQVPEETLAYLVEMAPELPIVRRLLAQLRAWLWRTFGDAFGKDLTADDIRVMAAASLRRAARQSERAAREVSLDTSVFASGGARGFFSPLRRAIEQSATARASAAQWKATLSRAAGVKKAELDWLGVNEWLDAQGDGPIERDALAAFVAENGVRLEEITLRVNGDPAFLAGKEDRLRRTSETLLKTQTEIQQVLREIRSDPTFRDFATMMDEFTARNPNADGQQLLTVYDEYTKQPLARRMADLQEQENALKGELSDIRVMRSPNEAEYQSETLPGGDNYREVLITMPNAPRSYDASHFDFSNILGWVRMNDRRDVSGRRILFVEEVQSDWGQAGRRRGYGPRKVENLRVEEVAAREGAPMDAPMYRIVVDIDGETTPLDRTLRQDRESAESALTHPATQRALDKLVGSRGVPPMPFQTTWPALMFKRVLREAVEGGYDAISWTNGRMQAQRYRLDMDGIVDIRFNAKEELLEFRTSPNQRKPKLDLDVSEAELASKLGSPELAAELLAQSANRNGVRRLTLDSPFDVRNQGMRGFYDKMMPSIAGDVGKRYGAKVEDTILPIPAVADKADAGIRGPAVASLERVATLPISDAMRASVMGDGVPMFAAGDNARGAPGRSTVESVQAEVRQMFGGDSSIMDAGFIQVVESGRDVPSKFGVPTWVGAVFDEDSRTVYLIAPRIRPGNVRRFVFHELGVHYGLRDMMGRRAFNALLQRIERMADRDGDSTAASARRDARMYASSLDSVPEETLAYWVERTFDAPNAEARGLLDELFAQVRAWLVRTFPELVHITDADIKELAMSSLRRTREQARRQIMRERGRDAIAPSPARDAVSEDPTMRIPDDTGRVEPAGRQLNRAELAERRAMEETKGVEAAAACAARHGMGGAAQATTRGVSYGVMVQPSLAPLLGDVAGLTAAIPAGYVASHLISRNADPYGYLTNQANYHRSRAAEATERARELSWTLGTNDERFPVTSSVDAPIDSQDWPELWDYPEPSDGALGGSVLPSGARVPPAPGDAEMMQQ